VIHAEGELQAAEKLRDAAAMLSQQPQALAAALPANVGRHVQQRKASTIVFPLPLDLIKPLLDGIAQRSEAK
jgi:hypothetical protein